jgi:PPK2 family polyphosphate:nucleotide phosphotransferase
MLILARGDYNIDNNKILAFAKHPLPYLRQIEEEMMEIHRIKPGKAIKLAEIDPNDKGDWEGKKSEGVARLEDLRQKLDQLQYILYAENKHKVLIVLQAMDTAGKDGTIRSVFEGINPAGVNVASFKSPTVQELAHDYLWRIHARVPGKGELVIFNRSHYEDVLIVRVHKWITMEQCQQRYRQINEFERMLADEGTTILKFFLHIDKEEQKKRLLERLDTPEKQWKFSSSDLPERALWGDYMQAYEDAINRTSTDWAPWYVVPANHNWYRNMVVADTIVETLQKLDMHFPAPETDLVQYRKQLESEGQS